MHSMRRLSILCVASLVGVLACEEASVTDEPDVQAQTAGLAFDIGTLDVIDLTDLDFDSLEDGAVLFLRDEERRLIQARFGIDVDALLLTADRCDACIPWAR